MYEPVTDSRSEGEGTDETVETDMLGNDDFLATIFGLAPPCARPIVVSFVGNPGGAPSSAWGGDAWHLTPTIVKDGSLTWFGKLG